MQIMKDSFGRTFPYIRMSITDVCNFKCGYCLPNGYQVDKSDNRKFLHLDEIKRLAKCFSELGVRKIRITGGEPTVRKDFFEIIKVLKYETGIEKVVITTNGYHLDEKAKSLLDSGLNGINISIDSLDPETFKKITNKRLKVKAKKKIQGDIANSVAKCNNLYKFIDFKPKYHEIIKMVKSAYKWEKKLFSNKILKI